MSDKWERNPYSSTDPLGSLEVWFRKMESLAPVFSSVMATFTLSGMSPFMISFHPHSTPWGLAGLFILLSHLRNLGICEGKCLVHGHIETVTQWLRLCASTAGRAGLIPGWITNSPYALGPQKKKKRKKEREKRENLTMSSPRYLLQGSIKLMFPGSTT